jgi:hydrogenase maturation protease
MKKNRYIFGFGNYLMGDDAIGIHIIDKIESQFKSDKFECVEIGNDGTLFLTYFTRETEKIVVVDCALIGKSPGEYLILSPDELNTKKISSNFSTHEGDILKLIELATQLEYPIPEIKIVAIQPKSIEFNAHLSYELKLNIENYIQAILTEINN